MIVQFMTGGFDPRSTCTGGSESCVIYLAEAMAARGHQVFVCNGVRHERAGVTYTDQPVDCDVLISWRNYFFNPEGIKYTTLLLWCHDIPVPNHAPASYDPCCPFDKVITLNPYHATLYAQYMPAEKIAVSRIGVPNYFFEWLQDRVPGKCVYISHPHRGLPQLRAMWPRIKAACPEATLHAFWWQPEFFMPPDEALGIMPMRGLDDIELAAELQSAELLTYPSVFAPEISPAACIKAQAAGAVPITVVASEGMRQSLVYGHQTTMDGFVQSVINAIDDKNWQANERKRVGMVQERFNWDNAAAEWEQWF